METEDSPGRPLPARARTHGVIRSVVFAIHGIVHLLGTQRNAKIHLLGAAVACAAGWWLGISRVEWAVLVFTIALVFVAEAVNTAFEAMVDLLAPEIHPSAKIAKDVAAAAVLVAAVAALVVAVLIFGPLLWARWFSRDGGASITP